MRFLMLTKVSEEGSEHFGDLTEADRSAGITAHAEWFNRHADAIEGGYELGFPPERRRVTADGVDAPTDGPFAETKEIIGGVIVLHAESLERATEIASEWPSLELYPGAAVEIITVAEETTDDR